VLDCCFVLNASSDAKHGSISFVWDGPHIGDMDTIIAMEVLFRYLQSNASSPMYQRFVERESPLCSEVAYCMSEYERTYVALTFNGIPTDRDADSDSEVCFGWFCRVT